ncbi:MAG: hypothetical protein QOC74_2020, partial [Pseudonocardiales bacterium]|nr:hypothetical protein [Pseudonocardiales bacterium]
RAVASAARRPVVPLEMSLPPSLPGECPAGTTLQY